MCPRLSEYPNIKKHTAGVCVCTSLYFLLHPQIPSPIFFLDKYTPFWWYIKSEYFTFEE